ncbi:DUF4376 domain-containing protein [Laribacter hongkongensis]|uniref:DUF4376 domain-containing protein n=1 Tax=Laribacter hongkongensis TaxID=168471 RepID=UPI001EFC9609|nr:DUF4376 domain-containing protein [Laribacter hongkongensis]MCG9052342.1 DUF4376 domain-containing protein [Laribacter hongkongensis]
MNFLIRFDEAGRSIETHVVEEKTQSQIDSMIDDGFLIVPESDYLLLIGNTTGKEHIRNPETGKYEEYVPPEAMPPTVDALRELRRGDINAWRDQQEMSGIVFEHAGRRWDGGLRVRSRLSPVVSLPELPAGFFWTDADNNDVPITQPELIELNAAHEAAITAQGFRIHTRQREMKQIIESMDREQLKAFVPGWPEGSM